MKALLKDLVKDFKRLSLYKGAKISFFTEEIKGQTFVHWFSLAFRNSSFP